MPFDAKETILELFVLSFQTLPPLLGPRCRRRMPNIRRQRTTSQKISSNMLPPRARDLSW